MVKLFLVLLGANPKGRVVEQHDYYFGVAENLKDLVPAMRGFWPDAGNTLHVDGWREINYVDGHQITVVPKNGQAPGAKRLFFINLGGYQQGALQETHHIMLTVQDDRMPAIKESMKTLFYKTNSMKGAHAHIDEKFGVDVDEVYRIEDVLNEEFKAKYHILIEPAEKALEDAINLGYFKLHQL